MKTWNGRPVVSDAHRDALETHAALLEFGEGVPRAEAEARAHAEYARGHHQAAAAHHLRGQRAALAAGDLGDAHKHGVMYALHLHALGHDPTDQVPDEVKALVEAEDKPGVHKFKAAAGDRLVLDPVTGKGK